MRTMITIFTLIMTLALYHIAVCENSVKIAAAGNYWELLSTSPNPHLCKIYFVRGIYEGLVIGDSKKLDHFYTKTSYETLIKALDQFYEDYRNENIFVVDALTVISMELRGTNKETVDKKLRLLRKSTHSIK